MPRYLFHAADGGSPHHSCGLEFADDAAARWEARRYLGELLILSSEPFSETKQLSVSVTDPTGILLFTAVALLIDTPRVPRAVGLAPANDRIP